MIGITDGFRAIGVTSLMQSDSALADCSFVSGEPFRIPSRSIGSTGAMPCRGETVEVVGDQVVVKRRDILIRVSSSRKRPNVSVTVEGVQARVKQITHAFVNENNANALSQTRDENIFHFAIETQY